MKIVSIILFIVGIGFFIAAFNGHTTAWVSAAMCFFASTMVIVSQKKMSHEKN